MYKNIEKQKVLHMAEQVEVIRLISKDNPVKRQWLI